MMTLSPARDASPESLARLDTGLDPSEQAATVAAQMITAFAEPALLLDAEGAIRVANEAAARLLGLNPAALVGQSIHRQVMPQHRTAFAELLSRALAAPATAQFIDTLLARPDGSSMPLHVTVLALVQTTSPVLLLVGAEVPAVVATPVASTPMRAQHDRHRPRPALEHNYLAQIHDLARALSRSLDLNQVLTDALRQAIEIFDAEQGYLIVLDEHGAPARWLASDDRPAPEPVTLTLALRAGILGDLLHSQNVLRSVAADSDQTRMASSFFAGKTRLMAPLLAPAGAVGVLVLTHDDADAFTEEHELVMDAVAETIALATQNAQLYTRLRDADAARERMTNLLVHDIRSPLMATHASIEITRRAVAELSVHPFVHESLVSGLRSVRSVIDLTNDLLDVKRLQSDAPTLNYRSIALAALLEEVCAQMQTLAMDRGITIGCSVTPQTLEMQADQRLLRRVLINLVANAVRFTPDGSVVELNAGYEPDGHLVLLTIDDMGPGVAPADRERIFLPFIQASGESHRGTGLGLAFCREVTLAHGGRIWVEERPGGGSRFCVLLPPRPSE